MKPSIAANKPRIDDEGIGVRAVRAAAVATHNDDVVAECVLRIAHDNAARLLVDLQKACDELVRRPIDPRPYDLDRLDEDVAADTDLGVVLLAGLCRLRIREGRNVTPKQLAALAGVDAQHVRLLLRRGEIREERDHANRRAVPARDAKRFLLARDIRV